MLQNCACSIPDILWLLSPSGPTEIEANLRESRNAAWPKYRTPSDREGGRAIWNARGRGASFSLSSSLACKLFGMGKSSFSSLSYSIPQSVRTQFAGAGASFRRLDSSKSDGAFTSFRFARWQPERDLLSRVTNTVLLNAVILMTLLLQLFAANSGCCRKSRSPLPSSLKLSSHPPFSFYFRNGG